MRELTTFAPTNNTFVFYEKNGSREVFKIDIRGCYVPEGVSIDDAAAGVIDALDKYIKNMNKTLIDDRNKLLKALEDLYQYSDAIVCYASTMGEHEPNRIAYNAKQIIDKIKGQ